MAIQRVSSQIATSCIGQRGPSWRETCLAKDLTDFRRCDEVTLLAKDVPLRVVAPGRMCQAHLHIPRDWHWSCCLALIVVGQARRTAIDSSMTSARFWGCLPETRPLPDTSPFSGSVEVEDSQRADTSRRLHAPRAIIPRASCVKGRIAGVDMVRVRLLI